MKPMTRILIGLEGYIMALISMRADGEYSVSETVGPSAYQRQKILKALIDEGKCTKHDVISYLQNRVSLNSNRQGFNSALTKWKADISYVKQL